MISIVPVVKKSYIPFSGNTSGGNLINTIAPGGVSSSTNIVASQDLIQKGNGYLKTNDFDNAIDCYTKAIEQRPEDKDTYFSLGKAYKGKEDYKNAINYLEEYVKAKSSDIDANIMLGECYDKAGLYTKAKDQLSKVVSMDPANDLAKRDILETENNLLSCYDPISAMKQKREQSINNLNQALTMVKDYLPTGYLKDMGDISIVFDKTSKLGGTSNIAQYENAKKKITVTDSYVYAAPQIIASYLVHEFVHAKDKDSYTSITEEQDAYKSAAEFWKENSKGIEDPEMDYVADLYKQSPATLDARVAEIYKLRDPKIATVSPNHPPGTQNIANSPLNPDSGQPLKDYDVIS